MNHNNIFYQGKDITDTAILDNMVNSALLTFSKEKDIAHITVGEIKDFSLCFLPKADETIYTGISIVSRRGRTVTVEAHTSVEGETAAKCRIKLFIEKNNETAGNTL